MANGENGNGNGFWRWVAGILAAILLTGLTSWFAFGHDNVSRVEMRQAISESMPKDSGYVEDKKAIQNDLSRLSGKVDGLSSDMNSFQRQLGAIDGKLEAWLQTQSVLRDRGDRDQRGGR